MVISKGGSKSPLTGAARSGSQKRLLSHAVTTWHRITTANRLTLASRAFRR